MHITLQTTLRPAGVTLAADLGYLNVVDTLISAMVRRLDANSHHIHSILPSYYTSQDVLRVYISLHIRLVEPQHVLCAFPHNGSHNVSRLFSNASTSDADAFVFALTSTFDTPCFTFDFECTLTIPVAAAQ